MSTGEALVDTCYLMYIQGKDATACLKQRMKLLIYQLLIHCIKTLHTRSTARGQTFILIIWTSLFHIKSLQLPTITSGKTKACGSLDNTDLCWHAITSTSANPISSSSGASPGTEAMSRFNQINPLHIWWPVIGDNCSLLPQSLSKWHHSTCWSFQAIAGLKGYRGRE